VYKYWKIPPPPGQVLWGGKYEKGKRKKREILNEKEQRLKIRTGLK
jgi:hypothetical protein